MALLSADVKHADSFCNVTAQLAIEIAATRTQSLPVQAKTQSPKGDFVPFVAAVLTA
jgi:hypothetical protein